MSAPFYKLVRRAVFAIAVLTLVLAPTAAHAVPQTGETGIFETTWSRLVELGERLAAAVGLGKARAETVAPPPATPALVPDPGDGSSCSSGCSDDDSGPALDPNG